MYLFTGCVWTFNGLLIWGSTSQYFETRVFIYINLVQRYELVCPSQNPAEMCMNSFLMLIFTCFKINTTVTYAEYNSVKYIYKECNTKQKLSFQN